MAIIDAKEVNTRESGYSFSLSNRLYRAAWSAAWLMLAAWTPPFLHGWRRFLLRRFGATIASKALIYPSVRIWSPANLEIGHMGCVGPRVRLYSMARITILPYALISQNAHLCAGTHDIEDPNFQLQARPITIGRHAWIAADAFVGPGVTVGDGAVLGARGCAFRDLAPATVYGGNPARELKARLVAPRGEGALPG